MKPGLRLRALRTEDHLTTWKWRNDPMVREYFTAHPFYVNPETEKDWYQSAMRQDQSRVVFAVETIEDSQLVALTYLFKINLIHRNAEIGTIVGNDIKVKGVGTESTILTLRYGFEELGLHCIYGLMFPQNSASRKMCQNVGFNEDGFVKERMFRKGKFHDMLNISFLAEDFFNKYGRSE